MKTLITVLLSAASLMILFGSPDPRTAVPDRTLTFAERVSYQRVIEEVYWRHRIWPKDRLDPKPSLDAVMSPAQLEKKVEDYLRDSLVLEDHWQKLITAGQLQAEMDRMARHTRQPEVLRELFEALGNDPAVIAECLARPILAERLIADLSAQGQTRWFDSPRTDNLRTMSVVTTLAQVAYTLPDIPSSGCTDDTWTPTTLTNAPTARFGQSAVWTGTEMVIWGGYGDTGYLNTGARYNPSTDSWTASSTINVTEARAGHTAVWTGSEMIVWGGYDINTANYLNSGGRYNPGTDSWTATSTTNAPEGRDSQTAVWTGSQMIIWGGHLYDGNTYYLNSGGRYNPGTDSWTATSMSNVPTGRGSHTAAWTGTEMIIWGGTGYGNPGIFNTGGRYNPSTDSWTPTSMTNVTEGRAGHTAVWTGSQMIVWGGYNPYNGGELNTGGKYNPSTDSWTHTNTGIAPLPRDGHTAVWTGSEMIVWGGEDQATAFNTGGRYNPSTNSWTATSTTNAPDPRGSHTAVWTGSQMIIWGGGYLNTGGAYCAESSPSPTPTPTVTPTPTPHFTPVPRPTPPPHITPVPPPPSPRPTAKPRPTSPPHITPVPTPSSPRPTPRPRP